MLPTFPISHLLISGDGTLGKREEETTHARRRIGITYQNTLREGLGVKALLRLLAPVGMVEVAGRHDFCGVVLIWWNQRPGVVVLSFCRRAQASRGLRLPIAEIPVGWRHKKKGKGSAP